MKTHRQTGSMFQMSRPFCRKYTFLKTQRQSGTIWCDNTPPKQNEITSPFLDGVVAAVLNEVVIPYLISYPILSYSSYQFPSLLALFMPSLSSLTPSIFYFDCLNGNRFQCFYSCARLFYPCALPLFTRKLAQGVTITASDKRSEMVYRGECLEHIAIVKWLDVVVLVPRYWATQAEPPERKGREKSRTEKLKKKKDRRRTGRGKKISVGVTEVLGLCHYHLQITHTHILISSRYLYSRILLIFSLFVVPPSSLSASTLSTPRLPVTGSSSTWTSSSLTCRSWAAWGCLWSPSLRFPS